MNASRIAAAFCGLAYLALGLVTLTGPAVPDHDWGTRGAVVDALGLVGFAINVWALERLRTPLALGRVGVGALRAAQVGLIAMSVESVVSLVAGGNTIGVVFFLGLVVTLLALLVVAVVGLRTADVRWVAPLPFVGLLVGVGGGEHGGFVVLGAVWLVLAVAAVGRPRRAEAALA